MKAGYNSHYVATDKSGLPAGPNCTKSYDELVVPQEYVEIKDKTTAATAGSTTTTTTAQQFSQG